MMRLLAGTALLALIGFSAASGAESQATVKSVDKKANTMVVTVDGKDITYPVSKDASFVTVSQVPGKKGKTTEKLTPIDGGLEGVKAGTKVTILTDMVDEKETVTSIKVSDGTTPAKKKKKKKTN
jgi:Cu/Ag efflux protein CusF